MASERRNLPSSQLGHAFGGSGFSPRRSQVTPRGEVIEMVQYTESNIGGLKAVNSLPECSDLVVPDGMFRCSRSVKPRSRAGKAKAARERALREKSGESGTGATETGGSSSAVRVKKEEAAAGASEKAEERKSGRLVKKPPPQQQKQPIAGPSRVKSERTSPLPRDLRVDTDLSPEVRFDGSSLI